MPTGVSLSDVIADRATVELAFGEATIAVTYRPQRVTFDFQDRIAQAVAGNDLLILVRGLCELVREWDLIGPLEGVGENGEPVTLVAAGKPIPLDPAVVRHMPAVVLTAIWQGISEHAAPNA